MAKLTDPNKVAETLKAYKGHRTHTAAALDVSRTALSKYIAKHIDIDCDYRVKHEPLQLTTHARPADDTTSGQ